MWKKTKAWGWYYLDNIKKGLTKKICSSDLGKIVGIMDLFEKNNWGNQSLLKNPTSKSV